MGLHARFRFIVKVRQSNFHLVTNVMEDITLTLAVLLIVFKPNAWHTNVITIWKECYIITIHHCGLMILCGDIWVSIGWGNGLLPDSTKPSLELMLSSHWRYSVAFSWEQFHKKCSRTYLIGPWEILMWFWKCKFQSCFTDWYLRILLW